jgi:class I fructose-bisphosphate aldolase
MKIGVSEGEVREFLGVPESVKELSEIDIRVYQLLKEMEPGGKFFRRTEGSLASSHLNVGQKRNLWNLMLTDDKGRKVPALHLLPYDQNVEHSGYDANKNPQALSPEYMFELVRAGGISGVVLHPGWIAQFASNYPDVPVIYKIDGKSDYLDQSKPMMAPMGSIEDAVMYEPAGIGVTQYFGTQKEVEDFTRLVPIRDGAKRNGKLFWIWAYPRGENVDKRGGQKALGAVFAAVTRASSFGADVIKLNMPDTYDPQKADQYHKTFQELHIGDRVAATRYCIWASQNSLTVISGGEMKNEEQAIIEAVDISLKAGADGFLYGRNMFQRYFDDAVALMRAVKERTIAFRLERMGAYEPERGYFFPSEPEL